MSIYDGLADPGDYGRKIGMARKDLVPPRSDDDEASEAKPKEPEELKERVRARINASATRFLRSSEGVDLGDIFMGRSPRAFCEMHGDMSLARSRLFDAVKRALPDGSNTKRNRVKAARWASAALRDSLLEDMLQDLPSRERNVLKKFAVGVRWDRGLPGRNWRIDLRPDQLDLARKGIRVGWSGGKKFSTVRALVDKFVLYRPVLEESGWVGREEPFDIPRACGVDEIVERLRESRKRHDTPAYFVYSHSRGGSKQRPLFLREKGKFCLVARDIGEEKLSAEEIERLAGLRNPPKPWAMNDPDAKRKSEAGPPEALHGTSPGTHLLRRFGLYGLEWGNWIPQKDRPGALIRINEALSDLSTVLNIPRPRLGLRGLKRPIGIGVGSRGRGGKRAAVAHYEPSTRAINLTRFGGGGSLAHEWFHAADDDSGWEMGRRIAAAAPKTLMARCHTLERASGRKDGYWSSSKEVAARSFEVYVEAKLEEMGIRSPTLVKFAEPKVWGGESRRSVGAYPYPYPDECEELFFAIERELKGRDLFRPKEQERSISR